MCVCVRVCARARVCACVLSCLPVRRRKTVKQEGNTLSRDLQAGLCADLQSLLTAGFMESDCAGSFHTVVWWWW